MKTIIIIVLAAFWLNNSYAQHDHEQHKKQEQKKKETKPAQKPKPKPVEKDTIKPVIKDSVPQKNEDQHQHHPPQNNTEKAGEHVVNDAHQEEENEHDMGNMSHAFSLNLPMNRNGSGTGWLPDSTPVYGYMAHAGKWMLMGHGNIFLRYTAQNFNNPEKRGESKFSAPNWFMGMAQRRVGQKGLFVGRAMISLDRITEGGSGYPLLFQSGETWQGNPLIDEQHPHDFLSELAVG